MSDKLTAKQARFIERIIAGDAATDAYRHAYSPTTMSNRSIGKEASRLMKHPAIEPILEAHHQAVADALAAASARAAESAGITRERVLQQLARIAFVDFTNLASWGPDGHVTFRPSDEISEDDSAAIKEIEHEVSPRGSHTVRLHLWDKVAALNVLARIMGFFNSTSAGRDDNSLNLIINITEPPAKTPAASKEEANAVSA